MKYQVPQTNTTLVSYFYLQPIPAPYPETHQLSINTNITPPPPLPPFQSVLVTECNSLKKSSTTTSNTDDRSVSQTHSASASNPHLGTAVCGVLSLHSSSSRSRVTSPTIQRYLQSLVSHLSNNTEIPAEIGKSPLQQYRDTCRT